MIVDFSKILLDPMDKLLEVGGKPYTVLDAATAALLTQGNNEVLDGVEKHKRYALWSKIKGGSDREITVEEAALIKKVVGQNGTPLVVGQVWDLLEKGSR